jgi:hypothetical protein
MVDIAGWIALIATCVAALMTASNLGARVTGWGFVLFTVGAAAWTIVGVAAGQTQLLYSNIFLGIVDVLGMWRWLGRRARISDAAEAEIALSRQHDGTNLFSIAKVDGLPIADAEGNVVAHGVDALAACFDGQINYLIVRFGGVGGVGETLHRLPWSKVRMTESALRTDLTAVKLAQLPLAER